MIRRRRGSGNRGSWSRQAGSSIHAEASNSRRGSTSSRSRVHPGAQTQNRRSMRVSRRHPIQGSDSENQQMPILQQTRRRRVQEPEHRRIQNDVEAASPIVQASISSRQRPNSPAQLIIAFERQPPSEIRTGSILSDFTVTLQVEGASILGRPSPIEPGSINAMATLVTADGQEQVRNPIDLIVMHPMTATAPERHFDISDNTQWTFHFAPINSGTGINASGHFRIRVVLINTPTIIREDGVAEVDSPFQLGSITSHLIHVHAFAPLLRG